MARLRVLKQRWVSCLNIRVYDFTHHGPFEGTETSGLPVLRRKFLISLTMARLRVLKLALQLSGVRSNVGFHSPWPV